MSEPCAWRPSIQQRAAALACANVSVALSAPRLRRNRHEIESSLAALVILRSELNEQVGVCALAGAA